MQRPAVHSQSTTQHKEPQQTRRTVVLGDNHRNKVVCVFLAHGLPRQQHRQLRRAKEQTSDNEFDKYTHLQLCDALLQDGSQATTALQFARRVSHAASVICGHQVWDGWRKRRRCQHGCSMRVSSIDRHQCGLACHPPMSWHNACPRSPSSASWAPWCSLATGLLSHLRLCFSIDFTRGSRCCNTPQWCVSRRRCQCGVGVVGFACA